MDKDLLQFDHDTRGGKMESMSPAELYRKERTRAKKQGKLILPTIEALRDEPEYKKTPCGIDGEVHPSTTRSSSFFARYTRKQDSL